MTTSTATQQQIRTVARTVHAEYLRYLLHPDWGRWIVHSRVRVIYNGIAAGGLVGPDPLFGEAG